MPAQVASVETFRVLVAAAEDETRVDVDEVRTDVEDGFTDDDTEAALTELEELVEPQVPNLDWHPVPQ